MRVEKGCQHGRRLRGRDSFRNNAGDNSRLWNNIGDSGRNADCRIRPRSLLSSTQGTLVGACNGNVHNVSLRGCARNGGLNDGIHGRLCWSGQPTAKHPRRCS